MEQFFGIKALNSNTYWNKSLPPGIQHRYLVEAKKPDRKEKERVIEQEVGQGDFLDWFDF